MGVVSEDGKIVAWSRGGAPPAVDLSQRKYFTALRDAPPATIHLSVPFPGITSGAWSIVLAQRVSGRNGEFRGIVAAVMELRTFEEFYAKVALGKQGSIALARSDGVMLARHPRVEPLIGKSNAPSELFTRFVFNKQNGVLRQASPVDGIDRIIAVTATAHFPAVIVVTASVEDLLAAIAAERLSLVLAAILATALILALTLLFAKHAENLSRASSEVAAAKGRHEAQSLFEAEHTRFMAAINNMGQGLVMFDGAENLIVCNQSYAELYKLPEELTRPGTPREAILDCRVTMATDRKGQRRVVRGPNSFTTHSRTHTLRDGRIIAIVHRTLPGGGWVSTHEDVTERRRIEDQVAHLAAHDPLTNLANRGRFQERLEESLAETEREAAFALLFMDLDHFKAVNDSLGHQLGDALLKEVTSRLTSVTRASDVVARIGGDEFLVLHRLKEGVHDAVALASRIIEVVSRPYQIGENHVTVGATIGISVAPQDTKEPDELIRFADLALYHAKAEERGGVHCFDRTMEAALLAKRSLDHELRQAVQREEFELFFQPLVSLRDQAITSFEALLRWNHPQRGLLAPGDFIGVAEETGLIMPIGQWALKQACLEATKWPGHIKVAVNLSAVEFRSTALVGAIAEALSISGLDGHRLEIEVTETVMLDGSDKSVAVLQELRAMGISIVMDDFGTGYSSLSYLRLFPFDKLKIDQSFIQELGSSKASSAIVRAATSLASSLDMTTTAEGIETPAQLLRAVREGCTEGQGFLFGRPRPASEIADFIATHAGRKFAQ